MKRRLTVAGIGLLVCGAAWGAGEILANLSIRIEKNGVVYINEAASRTMTLNAAAPNVSRYTVLVTTNAAGTALDLGSVVTNGVCWLQNTSTNNFCDVGVQVSGSFYGLIRLKAGDAWPVRITPGVTPYALANGASVVLKQPILDD